MAAAKKKRTSARSAREGEAAPTAEQGLGLFVGGRSAHRDTPALSDDVLGATARYVDILRWIVVVHDRHADEVWRLQALQSAVPALAALGEEDAISKMAERHGVARPPDDVGLLAFLRRPVSLAQVLEQRIQDKAREARAQRDEYAKRLSRCAKGKGDPVAVFAESLGVTRPEALRLSAGDLQMELHAVAKVPPPGPDELIESRDFWVACAVDVAEGLLRGEEGQERVRELAKQAFFARTRAREVRSDRTTARRLEAHRRGEFRSIESELPAIEAAARTLVAEAMRGGSKVSLGDENGRRTQSGPHNVAIMLVARLTGVDFSTVRDAWAERSTRRKARTR